MKGRTLLVRYADDFILGFENKEDAEKVFRVLFKRFEKYGLRLHSEKTRLVAFGQPRIRKNLGRLRDAAGAPSTFWASPITGEEPAWAVGDSTADGAEAVCPKSQSHRPMVPGEPARAVMGASRDAGPETQRTLWVLRRHGQLCRPETVSVGSDTGMEEVVGAPGDPRGCRGNG